MIIAVYKPQVEAAQPQGNEIVAQTPPKTIEQALKIGNIYSPEQFKQLQGQYDLTNYKTVEITI